MRFFFVFVGVFFFGNSLGQLRRGGGGTCFYSFSVVEYVLAGCGSLVRLVGQVFVVGRRSFLLDLGAKRVGGGYLVFFGELHNFRDYIM